MANMTQKRHYMFTAVFDDQLLIMGKNQSMDAVISTEIMPTNFNKPQPGFDWLNKHGFKNIRCSVQIENRVILIVENSTNSNKLVEFTGISGGGIQEIGDGPAYTRESKFGCGYFKQDGHTVIY